MTEKAVFYALDIVYVPARLLLMHVTTTIAAVPVPVV